MMEIRRITTKRVLQSYKSDGCTGPMQINCGFPMPRQLWLSIV